MKLFYQCIAVAVVITAFAVAFVPGVDEYVEATAQGVVGSWAR
jgi:hypothetical protein